jgi:amidase
MPFSIDGYVKASPACARAVLETVEALRKKGHECVEFDVPGGESSFRPWKLHGIIDSALGCTAFYIFLGLTSSDGYKKMTSHLGPDPMVFTRSCFISPRLTGGCS